LKKDTFTGAEKTQREGKQSHSLLKRLKRCRGPQALWEWEDRKTEGGGWA